MRGCKKKRKKKIKIGPRDVEIRDRSVRFTPRGVEKKVKMDFAIFRFVVTWAWWLVFEQPWCGGWFLLSDGVLAGCYGARVRWLFFTERGWLVLRSESAEAGFY